MKQKKTWKKSTILGLSLVFFALLLLVPNSILLLTYYQIPQTTQPLYHARLVSQLNNSSQLCIETPTSGLIFLIPSFRTRFILDGNIIPLTTLSFDRGTSDNLADVYHSDIICTNHELTTGSHTLTLLITPDLFNQYSTTISFEVFPDGNIK